MHNVNLSNSPVVDSEFIEIVSGTSNHMKSNGSVNLLSKHCCMYMFEK